jgi:hypothetical protein
VPKSLALLGEIEMAIQSYLQYRNEVNRSETNMGDPFHFFMESSRVDYYVAKLYEGLGNAPKSIEHYEKFLELWKDADPGIEEVEDAKNRLNTLRGK